jgi:diguanylate cyclase (GGDEF)-like protein
MASLGDVATADVGPTAGAVIQRAWDEHIVLPLKRLDEESAPVLSALLPNARNVVVVPLFAEGKPVGVLAVEYDVASSARIERRVLSMVGQFASHAALALRNAWLLEQVWKMAETDPLTGIANRRVFEATLERELARAERSGEQVSLVMMDIDHFKRLNDSHGHQAGDDVLRQLAANLTAACRGFDTPARFGGEEFAVILPTCTSKESLWIADRMRQQLSEMDDVAPITVSVGVATYPAHSEDAAGLVKAADEALYEAKRAGRNRVTRSRRRPSPVGLVADPLGAPTQA